MLTPSQLKAIEQEAERLYPYRKLEEGFNQFTYDLDCNAVNRERAAHIACAKQYGERVKELEEANAHYGGEIWSLQQKLKEANEQLDRLDEENGNLIIELRGKLLELSSQIGQHTDEITIAEGKIRELSPEGEVMDAAYFKSVIEERNALIESYERQVDELQEKLEDANIMRDACETALKEAYAGKGQVCICAEPYNYIGSFPVHDTAQQAKPQKGEESQQRKHILVDIMHKDEELGLYESVAWKGQIESLLNQLESRLGSRLTSSRFDHKDIICFVLNYIDRLRNILTVDAGEEESDERLDRRYWMKKYFSSAIADEVIPILKQLRTANAEISRLKEAEKEVAGKAWDAALRWKSYEDRLSYIPQTEEEFEEMKGEAQRELTQYAPPNKTSYINSISSSKNL